MQIKNSHAINIFNQYFQIISFNVLRIGPDSDIGQSFPIYILNICRIYSYIIFFKIILKYLNEDRLSASMAFITPTSNTIFVHVFKIFSLDE